MENKREFEHKAESQSLHVTRPVSRDWNSDPDIDLSLHLPNQILVPSINLIADPIHLRSMRS